MTGNFVVDSLEIEGFRGFNPPRSFKFEQPLVLLCGGGGRGKSSLLRAIEWCLFGNTAYLDFLESPRTKDELVNQHHPDGIARVRLVLRQGKNEYVFMREKERGLEKTKFAVAEPKEKFEGEKAEERCLALLGLTFTDFYRTIYLHQEAVRGILTDASSERDEAMDRLLGLEVLRNIVESVPLRDVREKATELQRRKDKIEDRIKGRVEQIERDRNKNQAKCQGIGITRENITLKFGRGIFELVLDGLRKMGHECKLEPPKIDLPTSVSSLTLGLKKAKKFLGECRSSIVEISVMDELTRKRTELTEIKDGLDKKINEVKKTNEDLIKIKHRYGEESAIQRSIKKLVNQIKNIEQKRKQLDINLRLITDAIEYLEKIIIDKCPICGSKIERKKIVASLQARIAKYKTKTIKELAKQEELITKRKEALESAQLNLHELGQELGRIQKEKNGWLDKISKIAGKELSEQKALAFLRAEIKKTNAEIKKLQGAYKTKMRKLQEIEHSIEKVKAIHDVLEKEDELGQLRKILSAEAEEIKVLESKILELNTFRDQLNEIIDAITTVQTRLASEMIKKASPKISQFYKALGGHPYYKSLVIGVQPKKTRGGIKNSYQIKAAHPVEGITTLVSTRFSASQMNCTALAIFLAMSETFSRRAGFLIVDDPSQNLDPAQKRALIQVLNKVLRRRQLFISTQDDEFQKLLLQLTPKKRRIIYNFLAWNRKDGPRISVSK